ncbi:hypothetical protein ACFL56_03685, partial [Candidatus Margulisiibacteriota bacterium]
NILAALGNMPPVAAMYVYGEIPDSYPSFRSQLEEAFLERLDAVADSMEIGEVIRLWDEVPAGLDSETAVETLIQEKARELDLEEIIELVSNLSYSSLGAVVGVVFAEEMRAYDVTEIPRDPVKINTYANHFMNAYVYVEVEPYTDDIGEVVENGERQNDLDSAHLDEIYMLDNYYEQLERVMSPSTVLGRSSYSPSNLENFNTLTMLLELPTYFSHYLDFIEAIYLRLHCDEDGELVNSPQPIRLPNGHDPVRLDGARSIDEDAFIEGLESLMEDCFGWSAGLLYLSTFCDAAAANLGDELDALSVIENPSAEVSAEILEKESEKEMFESLRDVLESKAQELYQIGLTMGYAIKEVYPSYNVYEDVVMPLIEDGTIPNEYDILRNIYSWTNLYVETTRGLRREHTTFDQTETYYYDDTNEDPLLFRWALIQRMEEVNSERDEDDIQAERSIALDDLERAVLCDLIQYSEFFGDDSDIDISNDDLADMLDLDD